MLISILIGFLCVLVGRRLVVNETYTIIKVACINNLNTIIQKHRDSRTLQYDTERLHGRLLHSSETIQKMTIQFNIIQLLIAETPSVLFEVADRRLSCE